MIAAMSSKLAAVDGEAQPRKPFRHELELDRRAAKTVDEKESGAAFAEHKAAIDDRHRVLRRFGSSCMMDSTLADPADELVEQGEREINLGVADGERRSEGDDVLVVPADVEHQAVALVALFEIALQRRADQRIDHRLVGSEPVLAADFHSQCEAHPVDIADDPVASLEFVEAVEEVRPLERRHALVVLLVEHLHRLERHRSTQRSSGEGGVGRSGREGLRTDELFARPQSGQRTEAVGERLAEHDDVGLHIEILHRPEFSGPEEAHLNLVVDQQDAPRFEDALEFFEITGRRDHVAAGALNRLDIERGELALAGLGVPCRVILAVEQSRELVDAVEPAIVPLLPVLAAKTVWEWHEVSAIAEMSVAAAIAIGRGDCRRAQRAAVIAALEGEHQRLAPARVAHELERILNRLRAADIELDATLHGPGALDPPRDAGGELDLFAVKILACKLRQLVELDRHGVIEARIAVTEIDRGVPHLQVEIFPAFDVIEKGALATFEQLGRIGVMHRIAVRAIKRFERQEVRLVVPPGARIRRAFRGQVKARTHGPVPSASLEPSPRRSSAPIQSRSSRVAPAKLPTTQ